MAAGDVDDERMMRDAYLAGQQKSVATSIDNVLGPTQTHAHNIASHQHTIQRPIHFSIPDLPAPIRFGMNDDEISEVLEHVTITYIPEKSGFEVRGKHTSHLIPQDVVIKAALGSAKDMQAIREREVYLTELKENILTLINTCEDEACEEEKLCDRCIMIKGWVS